MTLSESDPVTACVNCDPIKPVKGFLTVISGDFVRSFHVCGEFWPPLLTNRATDSRLQSRVSLKVNKLLLRFPPLSSSGSFLAALFAIFIVSVICD